MADAISVRPAEDDDRQALALLFAAVAEERDGIAAEPPVDVDKRAANWDVDRTFVALVAGEVVGAILIIESSFGFGEIAMLVAAPRRGRGVGTALLAAAIEWSRAHGLHKLTLGVFPTTRRRSRCTGSSASSRRGDSFDTFAAPMVSCGT